MTTKVLIVEDESIVALDLQLRLVNLGYSVPRVAANHDQTLAAVRDIAPDIVLMDINIAGPIDGIDTAAKIATPVIYLTAYSEEKTLERAKATRPYGYLIKPFSEKELHTTIQMALERHEYELRLKNNEMLLATVYSKLAVANRDLEVKAKELFQGKQQLEITLNSIGDGVITTDNLGNVTYMNPVAEQKTGWTMSQAIGEPISKVLVLVNEETQVLELSQIEQILFSKINPDPSVRYNLISKQGMISSIEHSVALMHDLDNNIVGAVLVFHDVSIARRQAKEMTYQATHDDLTGLVNRSEFNKRLMKAIKKSELLELQHALAYLDLDQFKIVNDTCGHSAGDELLRQVVSLLRMTLRGSDTLARLGGDEFGVLLESCPPYFAQQIAESLRRVVCEFHFVWEDRTFPISVSIGLVNFGGKVSKHQSAVEILRLADSACYIAKDQGRNRIHTYHADDVDMHKRHGEIDWYTKIFSAISEDRFVLYAQKIMSLNGKDPYQEHVEILLRMRDAESKLVYPMAFIPAAERYGLMPEIDRWVVMKALNHIGQHNQGSGSLFAINLSGASINDENFLPYVEQQLISSGVNAENICFEITETAAIANLMNARTFMLALQSRGCKFSLDDFGSGMSSFSYLKHLPVDFLKIDGTFVKDLDKDEVDAAMVIAINNIGHVMGIKTIAEFSENEEILSRLREIGVDFAQGYGVAHPAPLDSEK